MYSKKSFIMRPALALMCASAFGLFAANANAADPIKIGYVGGISGACGGLTHRR